MKNKRQRTNGNTELLSAQILPIFSVFFAIVVMHILYYNSICYALYWNILLMSAISATTYYNYTIVRNSMHWAKVVLDNSDTLQKPFHLLGTGHSSNELVDLPVYVSLTCVSFRIHQLNETINTILHGIVVPTHMFIFISQEPYLMDEGIQIIPQNILEYVATGMVSIIYTKNIGSHRKLLPLLQHFYNKDVLIATVDDDIVYRANNTLLYRLLRSYRQTDGNEVIALRSRRIGLCREALGIWKKDRYTPIREKITSTNTSSSTNTSTSTSISKSKLFSEYMKWKVHYSYESSEMFVLPTGTGGVLYRPRFFHPIVFDPEFQRLTNTTDDIMFRLACMARGTKVTIGCRELWSKGTIFRYCPIDPNFRPAEPNAETVDHHEANKTAVNASSSKQAFLLSQHRNLTGTLYDYNVHGSNDQQWQAGVAFLERAIAFDMPALLHEHGGEREDFCYFEVQPEKYCCINSCSA